MTAPAVTFRFKPDPVSGNEANINFQDIVDYIGARNAGTAAWDYVILPTLTTAQRDAITSPVAGTLIYNSTTGKLNFRAAAAWEAVTSA